MAESGLDFGLFGRGENLQTSDYRSAGSHQTENLKILFQTTANTWEEIYTVPEGKTFYVSGIWLTPVDTQTFTIKIGTGEAASEVAFFSARKLASVNIFLNVPTPIKFSSGTRISGRVDQTNGLFFILVGWEE